MAGLLWNTPVTAPSSSEGYRNTINNYFADGMAAAQQQDIENKYAQAMQAAAQEQAAVQQAAQQQAQTRLLQGIGLAMARNLIGSKQAYEGTNALTPEDEAGIAEKQKALQTAMDAAASTRRIADSMGIDLSGYGSDVTLKQALENMNQQQYMAVQNLLGGQSSINYYDQQITQLLDSGMGRKAAMREAEKRANEYNAQRTRDLTTAMYDWGYDPSTGAINRFGSLVMQQMLQENPQQVQLLANLHAIPKDEYNFNNQMAQIAAGQANQLERMGVAQGYNKENMGLQFAYNEQGKDNDVARYEAKVAINNNGRLQYNQAALEQGMANIQNLVNLGVFSAEEGRAHINALFGGRGGNSGSSGNGSNPGGMKASDYVNYSMKYREILEGKLEDARASGDNEKANAIQGELDRMDAQYSNMFGTSERLELPPVDSEESARSLVRKEISKGLTQKASREQILKTMELIISQYPEEYQGPMRDEMKKYEANSASDNDSQRIGMPSKPAIQPQSNSGGGEQQTGKFSG